MKCRIIVRFSLVILLFWSCSWRVWWFSWQCLRRAQRSWRLRLFATLFTKALATFRKTRSFENSRGFCNACLPFFKIVVVRFRVVSTECLSCGDYASSHIPRQQPLHNLSLLTWLKRGKCELISHNVIMNFPSVRILNSTSSLLPPLQPSISSIFLLPFPCLKFVMCVMFMLQYITEHLKQNCDKLLCKLITCFNGVLLRYRGLCHLHTRKNKMVAEWFLSLKISKIGSFITKSVFPGEGFTVRLHNLRSW